MASGGSVSGIESPETLFDLGNADHQFLRRYVMLGGITGVVDYELDGVTPYAVVGPVSASTGSVTVDNGGGSDAVNIQDGGNSITVDGTVTATYSGQLSEIVCSLEHVLMELRIANRHLAHLSDFHYDHDDVEGLG